METFGLTFRDLNEMHEFQLEFLVAGLAEKRRREKREIEKAKMRGRVRR